MKQGMSLPQFAAEVQRQAAAKRDFKVPTERVKLITVPSQEIVRSPSGDQLKYAMELPGQGQFPARMLFQRQLAEFSKVPWQYYERMAAEAPELVPANVNVWLEKAQATRLVRTMDGQARAFMGDRYRPLDNFDLFRAIAPVIMDAGMGMRVESIQITETRLYIKVFSERITANVKLGDVVQAGVTIVNSEVGFSLIDISPAAFRLSCYNGMTIPDSSLKKRHVGRGSNGDIEGVEEFFSDETRRVDDEAFWRKVADVVRGTFSDVTFQKLVGKMQEAAEDKIPTGGATLKEVTEVFQAKYGLNETEGDMILRNLIEGGDMSRWGMANALTATAKSDALSYERASELERLGGQVIELPSSEWKELVAA